MTAPRVLFTTAAILGGFLLFAPTGLVFRWFLAMAIVTLFGLGLLGAAVGAVLNFIRPRGGLHDVRGREIGRRYWW
jgi:hypothetical protein